MTPEGKTKKAVKKLLDAHGAYYFMPVQNGYGAPGLDFHGSFKGRAFAVETKFNKELTPRQEMTKIKMEKSGMKVFVVGEHVVEEEGEHNRGRPYLTYSGLPELEAWLLGLLS